MQLDPRLDDLLEQWEAQSFVPSAEELCSDCPEILDELRSRMQQLRRMDRRLGLHDQVIEPPQIAGYQVHGLIGEGGMGTVWQATQIGTQRTVALKIMTGWQSAPTRARERFRREVELASRLEHPNIARVYDGDVRQGIGYYAMELIDGVPLDQFVFIRKLNRRQVIELFATVCRAVHHAHQRGIIHRDLKPSNILVNAEGQPHVLDFGLAKELSADGGGVTMENVVPGTPRYMSPEQAAGNTRDVDVRSDIFSLGVILYELLLRQSPFGATDDPSQLLARVRNGQTASPRRIDQTIDRELNAILNKSLEPEVQWRYGSADALANDLSNYLCGKPVAARQSTTTYVAWKWLLRHRAGAAIAAAVTMLFTAGAIYSYVSILRQRAQVQTQADIAQAVNSFVLNRLLRATDPAVAQGTPPTLRQLLDRAAKEVDTAFPDQPLVDAAVRVTIGQTYLNLALGEPAELQLRRALEIREKLLGKDDPASIEAAAELAFVLESTMQLPEAERIQRRLLEVLTRTAGADDPRALMCLQRLGNIAVERLLLDESAALLRRAYEGRLRVLTAENPDTIWSMSDLGAVLGQQNKWSESEALLRGALALRLQTQGPTHVDTLNAELNLASLYRRKGDLDKAETMLVKCIAERNQIYGPDHPAVSLPMHALAGIRLQQGRNAEAYDLALRSFELRGGEGGLQTHGVMQSLSVMVRALAADGKHDQAARLLAPAANCVEKAISASDVRWIGAYCQAMAAADDLKGSSEIASRFRQHLLAKFGPDDPRTRAADFEFLR